MSDKTFDKLYKLIEYTLVNEEISAEEVLRGITDINNMAMTLSAWCLSNAVEKSYSDVCSKSLRILEEATISLLNYLVTKQIDEKVKLSNDALSRFLSLIIRFSEVFKKIVVNGLIIQEEKILCKVKKPLAISSEKVVEKGYIILLPLDLAAVLSTLGYVEPLNVQVWPT